MNIVDIVINFFNNLYEKWFPVKAPPPKWKLEPDHRGTYRLYCWNTNYSRYEYVTGLVKDEQDAKNFIANMERNNIYLDDLDD
jgi:hypothetical protein